MSSKELAANLKATDDSFGSVATRSDVYRTWKLFGDLKKQLITLCALCGSPLEEQRT